ncbi:MAG: ADP-forming succinate--CoA ligase subunit beta [Gammaproteobacteria bacterium]|nr:ADP-forming succinate--CoA ligase subunit beta [Gammaproteobacteria bacterium]NIN62878.1 ADP-forming succinate--CoA ligase subunit beta [Gammaproteobacteria bacterium]NIO63859.1 ADP-forming succinate--CoA ligase subunit beta [Gammaproteobacteria bacterium]NIP50237.1 ADP-forming succinate--CoA ligase subunit beta [Gammaproteobacteria bacterium]NIQ12455.1 ADP-forming succinate--CoA ligase subunit beta [Gammaproteobacteria bacterium]
MNLHEYQAKKLFIEYGIPVPPGYPAHSVKEAIRHATELLGEGWVIKAQVHAGGRGKAGGVKLGHSIEEVESLTRAMLGTRLITKQSAPGGQPVNCVLIQSLTDIKKEMYLGLLVDRASRRVAIIASAAGGMDIEEVAESQPEKILSIAIDPILGLQGFQTRRIAGMLGLDANQQKQLDYIIKSLYQLFIEKDLSLVEINPLIIAADGNLMALDAKVIIDDNALFRQPNLEEWHDPTQEDEKESIAKRNDLNYVTLDGNIACMVNGAGLAMATMDIIKLHGGEPANFLDVGGGATAERVTEAFKLIVSDKNVKAILVNIFGGIVRCDLIAEGIINAVRQVGVSVPVVVRLEGTNVEQGKQLLADSGLTIITADELADAAVKVVTAAGKVN